jgi:hypothetical protein
LRGDGPPTERARHFGRGGHRQSLDLIEPKAGITRPLIELDPRHTVVPKILCRHYTLDSAEAVPVRLNILRGAPNTCELLHIADNFFLRPGSQVGTASSR